MSRRIILPAVPLLLAMLLVLTACGSQTGASRQNGAPAASKDETTPLVGLWVPEQTQPLQSLRLEKDGVATQVVSRGGARSKNVGTWSIVPPSLLFFALPNARGLGVPIARYSYVLEDDRMTLEWEPDYRPLSGSHNWVPWIAGSDHLTVVLRKQ